MMNRTFGLSVALCLLNLCSNAQIINAGVGGNTTKDLLARIDKDVLSKKYDLVILMVGTNDMLNSKKMLTYDEYRQNLERIVLSIKANGSEIVLMSSPPVDSTYLFTRHDKKLFEEPPNTKIDKIVNIVKELARQQNIYFFDLNGKFKKLGIPQHNQDLFIKNERNSGKTDGVHPTALGYQFIAEHVFFFLKENGLLETKNKIVCFGDSITKGGASKENYPSYLTQRIENYSAQIK